MRSILRGKTESGMAAIVTVLGLSVVLTTTSTLVAVNAFQHNPLISRSKLLFAATEAIEGGTRALDAVVSSDPSLLTCTSASSSQRCDLQGAGSPFGRWQQLASQPTSTVPQYFLWTNPQFCFSSTSSSSCTSTIQARVLSSVTVGLYGAGGWPGHFAFEHQVVDLSAKTTMSTTTWWQGFDATDPSLSSKSPSSCTYDYLHAYQGPSLSGAPTSICQRVAFATPDQIDGSVFSNDSIYLTGTPSFGTSSEPAVVTTADPGCLFVGPNGTQASPPGCATLALGATIYTSASSSHGAAQRALPTLDPSVSTSAASAGCRYVGPTMISFFATTSSTRRFMNVWSPETSVVEGHDMENSASNRSVCVGVGIAVPANGLLYIANSTVGAQGSGVCAGSGLNPFDGIVQKKTQTAQIVVPNQFHGTSVGYNFTTDISTVDPDCEGDAFVRDASARTMAPDSGACAGCKSGISGGVTVVAENNVVIDGSLRYLDCGTGFSSHTACPMHVGTSTRNDLLTLIADGFVEVNRAGKPNCSTISVLGIATTTCAPTPSGLIGACPTTDTDVQAALCSAGPTLIIDAQVVALGHDFTVNDATIATQLTGTLTLYGRILQEWRGLFGVTRTSSGTIVMRTGYAKSVHADPRVPLLATPGSPLEVDTGWTAAASLASSPTSCGPWPAPFGSASGPVGGVDPAGAPC